ncbi:MAG TPA: hypothetical protein VIG72_12730 [Pontibacter sp.]
MVLAESSGYVTKEVLHNDFVQVSYCEADSLLLIKWKRQVDLEERKEVFLWGHGFSKANGVKNWLIDDEEIFIITTKEREWIQDTWTKMAAEAGLEKIAVYLPEYFFNSIITLTDFTQQAQKNYQRHGTTQHEVFTDYEIALTWIRTA